MVDDPGCVLGFSLHKYFAEFFFFFVSMITNWSVILFLLGLHVVCVPDYL